MEIYEQENLHPSADVPAMSLPTFPQNGLMMKHILVSLIF
jgi:hypothetical protein